MQWLLVYDYEQGGPSPDFAVFMCCVPGMADLVPSSANPRRGCAFWAHASKAVSCSGLPNENWVLKVRTKPLPAQLSFGYGPRVSEAFYIIKNEGVPAQRDQPLDPCWELR